MNKVKIIVLGQGLIPRGHGIAPKKEPFEVDLKVLNLILGQGGLRPFAIHPITGSKIEITYKNLNKIWSIFTKAGEAKAQSVTERINEEQQKNTINGIISKAAETTKPVETPSTIVPVNNKPEEKKEEDKKFDDNKNDFKKDDKNKNNNKK